MLCARSLFRWLSFEPQVRNHLSSHVILISNTLMGAYLTFLLKLLPFPVESVFVSSSVDELLVVGSPLGVASKNRRRGGSGVRDLIGKGDVGGVEVEPKEAAE